MNKEDERIKRISELYKEGKQHHEIADELDVSLATVYRIIKKTGEKRIPEKKISFKRKQSRKKEEKEKEEPNEKFEKVKTRIKKDYKNKELQRAIDYAKSFEDSMYLTEEQRNKLKKFIAVGEEGQKKRIISLCKKNKSMEEILKITKYSEGIVYRICMEYKEQQEDIELE